MGVLIKNFEVETSAVNAYILPKRVLTSVGKQGLNLIQIW